LPALHKVTEQLFGALDVEVRQEIEAALSVVRLSRGEVLFRQGDPGDALYIVAGGRLQAVRERARQQPEIVAEMGPGQPVGEVSLLTGEPRSLTVRAVRASELVRLSDEGFAALVRRRPQALLPLLKTLSQRLRAAGGGVSRLSRVRTVALVPLQRASLVPLLGELRDELERAGRTLLLDADRFDAAHGKGAAHAAAQDPREPGLGEWLKHLEEEHDFVVYVCDEQPTAWSARCLRQADRILFVARAEAAPGTGEYAGLLATALAPQARELLLLHDPPARPTGTAVWIEALQVQRHHHVRSGNAHDLRRVARFLAGRAVGVVLGGGGARGFAHAGVLRALQECGVAVDYVGGVSMGSLAAACFASEFAADESVAVLRRIFVDTRARLRYTWPLFSVLEPSRSDRALDEVFGDRRIEDLWLNYFCVASNITTAETKVYREGQLAAAVRASGRFPGLLPPVPVDGDLLVDGGLFNNLPIDVMRALVDGPIVASDVSVDVELRVDPELRQAPSPWELFWSRIRPSRPSIRFPGIAPVLMRALGSRALAERAEWRSSAALYLTPPTGGFALTAFDRLEAIVEIGYRYGLERLKTAPASLPRV
jgi:predicted acylesterase/phospholipase RssA/CRP-like cAMP-binding protein